MKSFTAKEFSRCPAKVYEAAREDGRAEVTHDRFRGSFLIVSDNGTPAGYKTKAKRILDEDCLGWRDILHILAANIEEFEEDAIKRIVRLINEKAPD